MKVGVFDSGIGGLSVAKAIEKALPELEILYREDHENLPYGSKAPAELLQLVAPILEDMAQGGCQVIVIACNTVSTNIITELRERISVPLVALEPMVKPAAEQTKSGVIAVCATPATLKSERYAWLKQTYAPDVQVLEPDCSDWAFMIEQSQVDSQKIADRMNEVLDQGADVIVLGCTHYHWIESEIQELAADRATVIQPEAAVITQLTRVLAQLS